MRIEQRKNEKNSCSAPAGPAAVTAPAIDPSMLLDEPEDVTRQTALNQRWTFWYMRRSANDKAAPVAASAPAPGQTGGVGDAANYQPSIKRIMSFGTAQNFWRIYDHLIKPGSLTTTTDYHLFKDGITPTWEDPQNARGGKWIVRLRKGLANRYWEQLVLAIIGEQFDFGNEVCGCVISVRFSADILSIWNRNADNADGAQKLHDGARETPARPPALHSDGVQAPRRVVERQVLVPEHSGVARRAGGEALARRFVGRPSAPARGECSAAPPNGGGVGSGAVGGAPGDWSRVRGTGLATIPPIAGGRGTRPPATPGRDWSR